MQILDGFKETVGGLSTMINGINPMVSDIDSHRNKEIAKGLLASGFSIEDITQFVDVDRAQLDKYLELMSEVQKELQKECPEPTASEA